MIEQLIDTELWNKINKKYKNEGGVYILRLGTKTNGFTSVNRFLNVDDSGILYIGKANCFLDRVILLKKNILYKSKGHEAAERINLINTDFERICVSNLQIELKQSLSPSVDEKKMLQGYLKEFGEFPPLNRLG